MRLCPTAKNKSLRSKLRCGFIFFLLFLPYIAHKLMRTLLMFRPQTSNFRARWLFAL